MYEVPPYMVDTALLPPPLMTSEPGSFAWNTFKVRIPKIIDDINHQNRFPAVVLEAMRSLRDEITTGYITAPGQVNVEDAGFWQTAVQPWLGHSWLEVPWYWAEAYFYRRVLEATSYFVPGAMFHVDPYTPQKQSELAPQAAPAALAKVLSHLPVDDESRFEMLLHASLWGNRTDLSYNVASALGPARHVHDERANLLVDDTAVIWEYLQSSRRKDMVIITDNAGTELLMDLALVDFLLQREAVNCIRLHLKPQPFFVSDSMPKDVLDSINVLEQRAAPLHELGVRLREYVSNGQLALEDHWFYTTCLHYFQMPHDLISTLQSADFVLLKGDANYRRLLGDAHWPATTPFQTVTSYFPAPFASLRTLKAELIVGLAPGQAEALYALDPAWRTNGRRGVIQSNLT